MDETLTAAALEPIFTNLRTANHRTMTSYPGEMADRQPVHTVYGGAHLFKSDTAKKMGAVALRSLQEAAPDHGALAEILDLPKAPEWLSKTVYSRVVDKLNQEPVEDFRLDFEDGYGNRPDKEEDGHARSSAEEVAKGFHEKTLPPFIGIRIKPLTEELKVRSIRTLDIFLSTLLQKTKGIFPDGFVVTLPKITVPEQVATLVEVFKIFEASRKLPGQSLKLEIMIETTQSILNGKGECLIPYLVEAAQGRCVGAHFGTYDYTAACNITAAHQTMTHQACDFARNMMQVALAGTPIHLSDGATNVMPVGSKEGVTRAWRLSFEHIQHSLENAFYQGWDLHPAQLPIRYAAVYSFFLQGSEMAALRLKTFMEKAAQATLLGDVFDDAATGQGLLNFFLRGMSCGAITEKEALSTGLTIEEIRSRSFAKILKDRKK